MKIYKDIEQQSPEWYKIRAGVLTGSILKDIMVGGYNKDGTINSTALSAMKALCFKLIGGEFSYDENAPVSSNYLTNMGNELEGIARAKYQEKTGVVIEEVGFCKKNDWLGLSPDGIGKVESDKYNRHIEVKCPLGNNSANFYKYMFDCMHYLKTDRDKYIWQIVHNFIVNDDLEQLDFVVYNPNLPKDKQLFIFNIKRKDIQKEIDDAEKRIKDFRKVWEGYIKQLIK